MRADEFIKIGSPTLTSKSIPFCGIGREQNATIEAFRANLFIDETSYTAAIHIISNELSKYGFLIGNDFLDTVELNVRCGTVTIKPVSKDDPVAEIYQISIDSELGTNTVDVSHLSKDKRAEKIQVMIDNYKPEQSCDVGIRMKLTLIDDEPINLRPRRLTPTEKNKVNTQIEEWLKNEIIRSSVSDYASPVVLV